MSADLEELTSLYLSAKAVKESAERVFSETQESLLAAMREQQRKSYSHNGRRFTVVASERSTIDEAGLKKSLGAPLWNKITTSSLDRQLLKQAMLTGAVDPVLVAQHTTVQQNKPHIRTSEETQSPSSSED